MRFREYTAGRKAGQRHLAPASISDLMPATLWQAARVLDLGPAA
ncbi:hypothetical protein ACH4KT_26690 [Streptomyces anulatus]